MQAVNLWTVNDLTRRKENILELKRTRWRPTARRLRRTEELLNPEGDNELKWRHDMSGKHTMFMCRGGYFLLPHRE